MRDLSETLLTAQKEESRTPYVKVVVRNQTAGAVNLKWEHLYSGSEADYYHAATMPSDGSLIRLRTTPAENSYRLYRQRVVNPGPGSDFSQWTYVTYGVLAVAACVLGSEVSCFWMGLDHVIYWQKSTDCGASWNSPATIDVVPGTDAGGIVAVYKPNGDLAVFFADGDTLYAKKRVNGEWQDKTAWNKNTGNLSGVACVYDGDYNLLVTGQDSAGNYRIWSLIYGDGSEYPPGEWSELKEIAGAPAGGKFEYRQVSMVKADTYRFFVTEKFTGTEAISRIFWSHIVPDAGFDESLFREMVPFNGLGEHGVAVCQSDDYLWLTNPANIWRAKLDAEESLELTEDVISLKYELDEDSGKAVIELRNDDGRYGTPGSGELAVLNTGSEIAVSQGYVTSEGNEVSEGLAFQIDGFEHVSSGGKGSLILYASGGWAKLRQWRSRYQMRWNEFGSSYSVKDIIALVLARIGLKLETKSESQVITSFFPDFTVSPESDGLEVIRKLLSFVPDVIFVEGNKVYLVNPMSSDASVYSYGTSHPILEGRYRKDALTPNRVQVEGINPVNGEPVIVNSFAWDEIERGYDRLTELYDRNIDTVGKAGERGESYLRQAEIAAISGFIRIPVNCGMQMYDVIDITDSRAGLDGVKKRVTGLSLVYDRARGEYEEKLILAGV